jgi:hypothetical protein
MILTTRQRYVIRAALSYALSNADDNNNALAGEPKDDGTDTINVGGIDGSPLDDSEVRTLIDLFEPPSRSAPEGLRAFKGTFLVAIDESEVDDEDDGEEPVTLDGLTNFLKDALALDVDTEDHGNMVGFQSAELLFNTLEELPDDEVRRLYGR